MIGEVFYWVFNMSIVATLFGGVVLAVGRIRRIPRRIFVFLWIVPFLRMILPLGLNYKFSLMSLISRVTTRTVTILNPSDSIALSYINVIMAAKGYFPIAYKTVQLAILFKVAGWIWLAGTVLLLIWMVAVYVVTIHEISDAEHLQQNIYISDKVKNAAVYGIIKPRIVLPRSYGEMERKYAIMHENAHIRRLDNLWRLLAFIVTIVHWFNPFLWSYFKLFRSDIEIATDETVISKCNITERKEYACVLLDCCNAQEVFASAFGGNSVRTRIDRIMTFKNATIFTSVLFSLLILILIIVLATNAG